MNAITEKNMLKMLICAAFAIVLLLSVLQTESKAALLDPEGTDFVNISTCTGLQGHYAALAGNPAHPIAAYDSVTNYIAYLDKSEDTWNKTDDLSDPSRVVLTKYDGTNCTTPIELTSNTKNPGNASHNAPSVYVDANEYAYVTYGLGLSNVNTENGPWVRRSTNPDDITAFESEARMRLYQGAELYGFTMKDGSVMFTGTDMHGRFDIATPYETSSDPVNYVHNYGQQVVTFGWEAEWSINGDCEANNFSKAVFFEGVGTDDNLYVTWGDGSGGDPPAGCSEDYRKYSKDSHQVFFAYSDDQGATWYNLDRTASSTAVGCYKHDNGWHNDSTQPCRKNPYAGILVNEDDYRITTTRQAEFRKIWADPSGTIYLTYVKSKWCDDGLCEDPNTKVSTDPGSLMMLKFSLGDTPAQVQEKVVNTNEHYWIGAIRKDAGDLYIWAHEFKDSTGGTNDIYEYVSTDDGDTWSRTQISPSTGVGGCNRMHGEPYNPFLKNSVRILFQCRDGDFSNIYLYRKSFAHSTALPTGWTNADIGTGVAAGDTSYWKDGTFLVHGAGSDIYGTSDKFRYVYQERDGDFSAVTRLSEIENTADYAHAGLMIRETLNADSKHASIVLNQSGILNFKRRTATAGTTTGTTATGHTTPQWLKLERSGDTLTSSYSADGVTWTTHASDTVTMNSSVYVGMAVASKSDTIRNTSTFDSITITGSSDVTAPTAPGSLVSTAKSGTTVDLSWTASTDDVGVTEYVVYNDGVAAGTTTTTSYTVSGLTPSTAYAFTVTAKDAAGNESAVSNTENVTTSWYYNQDIGSVGIAGSASDSSGVYTVKGSGSDIYGTADEFHFAHQTLTGDGSIIARVASISSTSGQSGVMMRESLTAGSKHAFVNIRAIGGSTFKRRTATDGSTSNTLVSGSSDPYWVKLERVEDTFYGYDSSDGVTWTLIDTVSITMGSEVQVGLAVTSQDNLELNTTEFDNVTITETWSNTDIGNVGIAGSGSAASGVYTVEGSGADIWGTADEFHYMHQALSGDGTIVARVASITSTSGQSGVMMRESLAAGSKHAFINLRAIGDIKYKHRATTDGTTLNTSGTTGVTDPYWVKLERIGNTFYGYDSSDGVTWTLVDTLSITMNSEIYVGLAVTSQDNNALNTSTFDNVTVTE